MKENNTPVAIKRTDYSPPAYWIETTKLNFSLFDTHCQVVNTMSLRRNSSAESGVLALDGVDLELGSIALDGRPLTDSDYQRTDEHLILDNLPDTCQLRIITTLYPDKNTALEGLYKSSGNYCTQCEAQGFRKITYYLDRPDVLSRFTVTIEADSTSCPVMLSNGNLMNSRSTDNNRHIVEWQDPYPKPSYLFALVAGKLESLTDSFITSSDKEVQLVIYVEAHNLHKCDYAMVSLKESMRWDEAVYGLEYDLDVFMIVAVDDFNMGAMENKGLNIFNSKYVLADQATATDSDFMGVEAVIAHEYFHNWTGNRVTCRDWFQLSLKEGLTVFRDQEFSSDMNSRAVKRIQDVRMLRARQFPEDAGPMAHPIRPDEYIEINNFYTVTVYEKGAEVIRMIHTLLGPSAFRQGIDLYFERFDGQAVTCDDFVQAMQDASGTDLEQFRLWYSQAGTPVLDVTAEYEASSQEYRLHVKQSCMPTKGQDNKSPFHIPLSLALLDDEGNSMALFGDNAGHKGAFELTLDLRNAEHTFVFSQVSVEPTPSLLRNFSAPVILNFDYGDQQLAHLMANDTDSFNRWDAGQRLYRRVIESLMENKTIGVSELVNFNQAFDRLINNDRLDPALLAAALTLPDIESVSESHETIRVEEISQAIRTLKQSLATRHRERLKHLVDANQEGTVFVVNSEAIGQRCLKNVCLKLLSHSDPENWLKRVMSQFHDATNMTDRIAALDILCQSDVPERAMALTEFYDQWQTDRLVIDKWFSLQAMSSRDSVVDEVLTLTEHPAFELSNPNRVRSLIGAFAMSNTAGFHRIDGRGYQLLADYVLTLDKKNPQIAARMVGALGRWRRFDTDRQKLMQQELKRVATTAELSPDVFEIVTRSLDEPKI